MNHIHNSTVIHCSYRHFTLPTCRWYTTRCVKRDTRDRSSPWDHPKTSPPPQKKKGRVMTHTTRNFTSFRDTTCWSVRGVLIPFFEEYPLIRKRQHTPVFLYFELEEGHPETHTHTGERGILPLELFYTINVPTTYLPSSLRELSSLLSSGNPTIKL
jgi:hypothetical protein